MPATQVDVHVHPGTDRSLVVEPDRLTVRTSFDVVLHGHGAPAHVHCRLDEPLADLTDLEETNHYVAADETTVVPVTLEAVDEGLTGGLEVAIGYGGTTERVEIAVEPTPSPVRVDETLAEPAVDRARPIDRSGTAAVAVLALAVAGLAAFSLGGPAGVVGVAVVAAGVLGVAAVLLPLE